MENETTFLDIIIPDEMTDKKFIDAADYIYWSLRKNRTYFIDFSIDEQYCLVELGKEILRLNQDEKDVENPEPIQLWIHCYGGDLDQAMFFCDLVRASRIPIITVATGVAMSAGLLIFLSGERRYAFRHSQFLIHQGSAEMSGTASQIKNAQENYERQLSQMQEYILDRTKITKAQLKKKKDEDWYVLGDDIEKYGIADKIVTDIAEIQ